MKRKKTEVELVKLSVSKGTLKYRVVRTKGIITPLVGEMLTQQEVEHLIGVSSCGVSTLTVEIYEEHYLRA